MLKPGLSIATKDVSGLTFLRVDIHNVFLGYSTLPSFLNFPTILFHILLFLYSPLSFRKKYISDIVSEIKD
jgi:uncharacterized membrane protein